MTYKNHLKPCLDRSLAIFFGLILLPFFILLYLILLTTQGRPIFFRQWRTGKNRERFMLYKFRTLKHTDTDDLSIEGKEYTLFGQMMRKLGIDELPQLYNILKGEMSFVGPRPMPVEYEKKYTTIHLRRFEVLPGITGWAQVNGRNKISWGKRFRLDLWYVQNISLKNDFRIFRKTILSLFSSIAKLNQEEEKMEIFNGTNL